MKEFFLSNGIRVVCESMPALRSVSIGMGVRAGSILEAPEENGLSHYMEHMAFKGTHKRTARQIAQELDRVGGYLNAATGKLNTIYYAKVIDEDLSLAVDVLSDLITDPLITNEDFDKERSVILEEIAMVQDCPDDLVFDLLSEAVYDKQALALPVLGSRKNIEGFSTQDLKNYRNRTYSPQSTCVSVAGHFDEAQLRDLLEKHLASWQGNEGPLPPAQIANAKQRFLAINKNIEQTHIAVSFTGVPLECDQAYDLAVFSNLLGGSDSSRLFQRIREELGLVYNVYTMPSSYPSCGEFTLYAACSPKNTAQVISLLAEEAHQARLLPPTEDEFLRARSQLRGAYILGLESAYSRMNAMLSDILVLGHPLSPEEVLQKISRVTPKTMMAAAEKVLSSAPSAAIIGKNAEKKLANLHVFSQNK